MEAIELRCVKTPIGDGLLLGQRLSGSGHEFADVIVNDSPQTFLASAVKVGRKSESLNRRLRLLYRDYLKEHPTSEEIT